MKTLLKQIGWRPREVHLVATTIGPGSFTGLRVGVTTAKAFAYSAGADILGVDTLETIAAGVPDPVPTVSIAVDAQRGQVVARSFQRASDQWFEPIGPARLIDTEAWLAGIARGACVTGPVLRKIASAVPDHVTVLDSQYWAPTASAVARLAARRYAAGERDDVWSLVPRYSRQSAAEEKREKRRTH